MCKYEKSIEKLEINMFCTKTFEHHFFFAENYFLADRERRYRSRSREKRERKRSRSRDRENYRRRRYVHNCSIVASIFLTSSKQILQSFKR